MELLKKHLFEKMFFLSFCFIVSVQASAQLCQGSLGDPVVNITFGSGSNPGGPLNGLTNYTYTTDNCPQDGLYTIANSVDNCFNGTWHQIIQDHTPGDVNGYMMVVNASFQPGDFFVKTVDGLCPSTTYEFAAWILNLLQPFACGGNGKTPNITFNIETTSGTVLQSYQTGDISSGGGDWKQYGFFFSTTTAISSVVLRMTNNAPGGCGNDLLLDDITFRACGPLVTANINGSVDSVSVCEGNNSVFTLHANVSAGYNNPAYQWQQSNNNGVLWVNISGATDTVYIRPAVVTPADYLYRLQVFQRSNAGIPSCAIVSNVIVISVNKYPVPAASNRGSCTGDTAFFSANDGAVFLWKGPANFTSTQKSPYIPNATFINNGTYYVTVTSAKGCATTDSTKVQLSTKPTVNAGPDADICEGATTQLNGSGTNITGYQWVPASALSNSNIPNPTASPLQTTLFILTVNNNNCRASDSVLIVVNKKPIADAGTDKTIIKGQSVVLNGTAQGTKVTYRWAPTSFITGDTSLMPMVNPPVNQIYTLQVSSMVGCGTATDNVLVKVFEKVFVPNAFTPNNDGKNDTWFIETLNAFPGAEVRVFNRFGEVVFDNHGNNKPWDGFYKGRRLSTGAYAYTIDLKNKTEILKGVLYIIY